MSDTGENQDRYTLDKWGNPRCVMPVVEWDNGAPTEHHACGAEMYVEWTFTVPIQPGDEQQPHDVPADAISSGWQVICTNGHTLRFSSNGLSATDSAEPCDFDLLFHGPDFGSNAEPA